jgi:hypothetical protein
MAQGNFVISHRGGVLALIAVCVLACPLAIGAQDDLATVIAQLHSADPNVQSVAMLKIRDMGPRAASAVPDLRRLLRSKDHFLRLRAAEALAAIGPAAGPAAPELTGTLIEAGPTRDLLLGSYSGDALVNIGPPVVGPFLDAIQRAGRLSPRARRLTGDARIMAEVDAYENMRDEGVMMPEVIQKIGTPALAPLQRALDAATRARNYRRMWAAAFLLGFLGRDAAPAIPTLEKAAAAAPQPEPRREIEKAIAKAKGEPGK